MKFYARFIYVVVLMLSVSIYGQTINIDANINSPKVTEGVLKMGNSGPIGKEITINNKYMSLAGTPILPVMGEVHFSRCNPDKWESLILKMKANGITIISTYVFWIYHEEEEGVFNWEGRNNLRRFIELCKKHNVWAYPRIGPWCHGEVRNGALPDWILKKDNLKVRTNDANYMAYVDRWYQEVSEQLKGFCYKDGGPIVGIQLENEYWRGKGGEHHIMALKKIALKYGIDVPMYTVTGWRNASVPENEVVPLWGGYPAAPWNTNLKKITKNESYVFSKPVNDQSIGHKEETTKYKPDYSLYPYFTCELGVGNQISEHRRPIIDPIDGVTISTSSVASGSNLPGYYVFAGGLNAVGKFTTLEENKDESGYWNEYPDISYDFQAAIRETGETSEAYKKLKPFHYFLSEFGDKLAPMTPVISEGKSNPDSLQYAFRVKDNSGFLFVSNYYRGHEKSIKKDVQFNIVLKEEGVTIPSTPINIKDKTVFVWPVNLEMERVLLKHASAQLICNIENKKTQDWYFSETENVETEFLFSSKNIESICVKGKEISKSEDGFFVKNVISGTQNPIVIKSKTGNVKRVFVLTKTQKDNFWLFKTKVKDYAFISTANLTIDENLQLQAFSTNKNNNIISLNSKLKPSGKNINGFKLYNIENKEHVFKSEFEKADLIDESEWLKIASDSYKEKKALYRKLFFKTFNLKNTAEIKQATFYMLTDEKPNIRINGKWLKQAISSKEVNKLDYTGYLKKGKNDILIDFPYVDNNKVFVGVLEVEFYNAKKVIFPTDVTWLTTEQYKIPAPWENTGNKKTPFVLEKPNQYKELYFSPHRYKLKLDKSEIDRHKNVYLRVNYWGDKITCYSGENLVADNFNNGTTWSINLTDIKLEKDTPLVFEIKPYEENAKIYFDQQQVLDKTGIYSVEVIPEFLNVFQFKK